MALQRRAHACISSSHISIKINRYTSVPLSRVGTLADKTIKNTLIVFIRGLNEKKDVKKGKSCFEAFLALTFHSFKHLLQKEASNKMLLARVPPSVASDAQQLLSVLD